MKIIWTKHSLNRQLEWEMKLGITKEDIKNILNSPEQIVKGDMDAMIAQSKFDNGLIRVPFVREDNNIKILTLYWTSKIERYWKEGEN